MARPGVVEMLVALLVVHTAMAAIFNSTIKDVDNAIEPVKTRRSNTDRSTSSSSGERIKNSNEKSSLESLDLSTSASTSSEDETRYPKPVSSAERRGWRKWHRKCTPCPEDAKKKWRDPTIGWVCGAYQRARRSFKSACMMRFRNCQDGTMFVKITDRRCENDTTGRAHGSHFFYDYKVVLSDDSSDTSESVSDTEYHSEETDSELDDFRRQSGNKTKA